MSTPCAAIAERDYTGNFVLVASIRHRLLRWATLAAMGAVLVLVALSQLGRWLVVADPLQRADAIVIFGGGLPFRAMEGAAIYGQGWVPEVWVTQAVSPEEQTSSSLGIDFVSESGYSRRVLQKLGVPAGSIRMLEPPCVNTTDEVKAALATLEARGGRRLILVSSKAHTRRIRVTWRALAGRDREAIVRYTDRDPYQPGRWWANSRDVLAVTREFGGILNAWVGFPLGAARK
jgi:uncharacterized SAM-binding protein YcdF (DUF218 family)